MEKAVSPLEELFLGREVEVVLEDCSATNPPPGVLYPNEGVMVGFDRNGVVLQRKKGEDKYAFFPYSTIRCIRRKPTKEETQQKRENTASGVLAPSAAMATANTARFKKPGT